MPRQAEPPRLYLREDGDKRVWIIRDKGRDQRTGCAEGDRAGAEKKLAAYLAKKHAPAGEHGGRSDTISIAKVLNVYGAQHGQTTARPELIAEHIAALTPYWAGKKVSEIKGATCREFAGQRKQSMARRQLETLRAAVNYYHKEYGLDPVPAFTMPKKAKPRERWLTRKEAARLLRVARGTPHLARFILVGLYTGTRSTAILRLSWMPSTYGGWVDLEKGVLYRRSDEAAETKKRQTPARIPNRLLPHLRRWRKADRLQHVVHWRGTGVDSIKKAFRSARREAKLDAAVTPHTLRHTCATWLMQAGTPKWEAAGFLGMTEELLDRTYGHHHPDFQKSVSGAF